MNERIQQLALQAGLKQRIWNSLGKELPMWQEDPDNPGLEKFAELIVKECIVHGKLTQSQTVVNGSEEYNAGREMGIEVFMNQIRKHFGVEE